jgi:uncharacterized glyoxalase superfamily protein PhnB
MLTAASHNITMPLGGLFYRGNYEKATDSFGFAGVCGMHAALLLETTD